MIAVSDLRGVGTIPDHRTSAGRWMARHGVAVVEMPMNGGTGHFVDPVQLPEAERLAWLELQTDGLTPGEYDDAAHRAFDSLSGSKRQRAEHKAEIARFITKLTDDMPWPDKAQHVAERFGEKGNSERTLRRMMERLDGVAPINWAPALASDHKGRTNKAATSDEAWRWFLSLLRDAAPEWPIKEAWKRTKREAKAKDWDWPSYQTITRRWNALDKREQIIIQHGVEEADKQLYQSFRRDPTTLQSLELISLDGRKLDVWADFGDGTPRRPVMLALTDCASGKVLDFIMCQSEKVERTRDLIVNTCQAYGAFDQLYTDNGSAFASHMISGRAAYKFRGKNRDIERERPGVCAQLGIEVTFALPANGQAKIAERKFCDFSRQFDDAPEFHGAHAGHKPGERPSAKTVPVSIETVEALYRREMIEYNAEANRRSAACKGKRSYDEAFKAGLEGRTPRVLTDRQIKLARLDYKAVTVDKRGQFRVLGWTYGSLRTQDALLKFERQKIFVGYEPDDLSQPVVAYDTADERLICEGVPAIEQGERGNGRKRKGGAAQAEPSNRREAGAYSPLRHGRCIGDTPRKRRA